MGLAAGLAAGSFWPRQPVPTDSSSAYRSSLPAKPAMTEPATVPVTWPIRRPFVVPDKPLARHVLIVTIDGLRPDLPAVADMPNLRAQASSGSYTFWARTVDDPYVYTLPAHVSIATGVHPDRHGVTWNEYIEESYPQVPTIFELAKARGLSTALVTGKMKFIAMTNPVSLDWKYIPADEPVADEVVASEAVRIVEAHRPNLVFVHLPGVDTAGHESGWGSPPQHRAAAAADAALGRVMSTYRKAGLLENTLVLVTADHGGTDVSHYNGDPRSRTIPWIASGPGVRRGADLTRFRGLEVRTEDTFSTACAALGIPVPPDCDGRFVEEILEGRQLLFTPATAPARR